MTFIRPVNFRIFPAYIFLAIFKSLGLGLSLSLISGNFGGQLNCSHIRVPQSTLNSQIMTSPNYIFGKFTGNFSIDVNLPNKLFVKNMAIALYLQMKN
jgi:hypothetical protein